MDYEKKYKEALERAKDVYTYYCDDSVQLRKIKSIFPELRESEDEKIRKFIIEQLFKVRERVVYNSNIDRELANAITWLEKQSDTNETINNDELAQGVLRGAAINLITWIDYNAAEGNTCLSNMECKDIEDALVSGDWNKIYDYMKKKLERQDVEKPTFNVVDWQPSKVDGKIHNIYNSGVEPKFHKDEWIVNNATLNLCHILRVEHGQYICDDCSFPITKENEYHLWTIADAKDGDVLISHSNQPFIYNGNFDSFHVGAHCAITINGAFVILNTPCDWTGHKNLHPATKEQRDTLFAKMNKAGYEWDEKTHELKKIVVPIFNIGDTIIKKHNSDINMFGIFTVTAITCGKYWYNGRIICNIQEQDEWELVEQKSAEWNEEDETILNNLIDYFEVNDVLQHSEKQVVYWLKSLKERIGG